MEWLEWAWKYDQDAVIEMGVAACLGVVCVCVIAWQMFKALGVKRIRIGKRYFPRG